MPNSRPRIPRSLEVCERPARKTAQSWQGPRRGIPPDRSDSTREIRDRTYGQYAGEYGNRALTFSFDPQRGLIRVRAAPVQAEAASCSWRLTQEPQHSEPVYFSRLCASRQTNVAMPVALGCDPAVFSGSDPDYNREWSRVRVSGRIAATDDSRAGALWSSGTRPHPTADQWSRWVVGVGLFSWLAPVPRLSRGSTAP